MQTRGDDRDGKVEEYLQLLQSLACELERAMQAIEKNSLSDFEGSVARQQEFSSRLDKLASELSISAKPNSDSTPLAAEDGLTLQIHVASAALQSLNRRYAALIAHSSRSVAMMVSLFDSFRGKLEEVPGTKAKLQTWSCQV